MLLHNMKIHTTKYSMKRGLTKHLIVLVVALVAVAFTLLFTSCDSLVGYSVVGQSPLTAKQIDTILCNAGSPACGTGQALYSYAAQYNIKSTFALALFNKESTDGTKGVARATKGLGNIRCVGWSYCIQGYRAYASWEAGYADFFHLISTLYIQQWKLTTVDQIITKYAPTSENDTPLYIQQVEASMDSLEGQA